MSTVKVIFTFNISPQISPWNFSFLFVGMLIATVQTGKTFIGHV